MLTQAVCRTCRSPAVSGMYYCSTCLLVPVSQGRVEPANHLLTFHPGSRIDRFEIVESLGVGGFSEVYSVVDSDRPQRPPLAIKVMRMGLNSIEFLSRFEQEHQIIRRLEDPGIVRVYESGMTEDGRPFFLMEQIDGLRITDYCDAESLSLEPRIELFIEVCRAVHHAHQKGIIHRDLKPANILVTDQDGVSLPRVIDFGLAKAVESWNEGSEGRTSNAWVTGLGVALGTPGYISPEQEDGIEDVDTLSDTFSLGVVLYELVAQRPPWPHETWKRIPHSKWSNHKREHMPLKPSAVGTAYNYGRRIDDDLDTVCYKALATDREQRYQSVSQLATDLAYWLKGDPILAKPPSLAYRLRKLTSRYRWQSATLVASLATCLVAAILGVTLAIRERRYSTKLDIERNAAIQAKALAVELGELAVRERTVAQQSAYASSINLATIQIANGEPFSAEQILNSTQSSLRGWEWQYLQAQVPRPVLSVVTGLSAPTSLSVSANRRFAVVCDGGSIVRIDLQSRSSSKPLSVAGRVQHLAISNDGRFVGALVHPLPVKQADAEQEKAKSSDAVQTETPSTETQPPAPPASSTIRVFRFEENESTRAIESLSELWLYPVNGDSSLEWEPAESEPTLVVVEGNGPEPTTWKARKFSAVSGEVLATSDIERWKLADKGLLVGKSLAIVRCSFDRLAVLRLSDLSVLGYVIGFANNLIADFQLNQDETRVVFTQGGAVYEAAWEQAGADAATIEPNEMVHALFEVDEKYGDIHRLNQTADHLWTAITDTHVIVEGSEPVALPQKLETQFYSLLDGTYATILPHGSFDIRRDHDELTKGGFSSRSVEPSPEGRRVVIAPTSDYCLYQVWSRKNILRCSLLDDSANTGMETPENRKLEWCRLPAFHSDGTAIIAVQPEQVDGANCQLAAMRWDAKMYRASSRCRSRIRRGPQPQLQTASFCLLEPRAEFR